MLRHPKNGHPSFAHQPCFLPGLVLSLAGMLLAPTARSASATIPASKDNTIYGNGNANLSNGEGPYLLAGSSGEGRALRSLIAFNLAGQIPAGATINSVTLRLTINTPLAANSNTVRVHRVLADWGEGTSISPMGGGIGAPPTTGDATWNARFFNTANWSTPGGDFAPTVSASQSVTGGSGTATFSSIGLIADVQAWVNAPASNFGWILVAQDETGPAVRFASREGAPVPALVVDYTPASSNGSGNTAPSFTTHPGSQTVPPGTNVTFSVSATGTPAPTLQWRKDGTAIAGATSATLVLPAVTTAQAGTYTVIATNVVGSVSSNSATLAVTSPPAGTTTARLSNLSVRAAMEAGQTLIVGFSVSGSRSIVVRGVGPTLGSFGLAGTMPDPRLELYDNTNALVAQNEDWGNSPALTAAFAAVGAFPLLTNSRDAALLQPIEGTRSVHLKGTGAGVALVELYDTGSGLSPRLVNVSARNQVGTGDNILIFGFFIDGTGSKNVLIRAIGPRLGDLGVSGAITDPRFEVLRAGSTVASNDNWDASLAATFSAVGAFPLTNGSRDAALVTALTPGSYTVQVSGVNNVTGEALVEIYEVP
jgi:hypothetical protein